MLLLSKTLPSKDLTVIDKDITETGVIFQIQGHFRKLLILNYFVLDVALRDLHG